MPDFEVVAAAQKGEVKNTEKWGAKKDIALTLKATDGTPHEAVWWADATDPIPAPGTKVTGELEASDYGIKFRPPRKSGGGGGGGGRPRDPAERRSIAMQHAQKCAVSILEVAAGHGDYHPPSAGDVAAQVKTIAAVLWAQVQEAENATTGMVKGLPVRNEPVRSGAPDTVTPSAEYPAPGSHEPFDIQDAEAS